MDAGNDRRRLRGLRPVARRQSTVDLLKKPHRTYPRASHDRVHPRASHPSSSTVHRIFPSRPSSSGSGFFIHPTTERVTERVDDVHDADRTQRKKIQRVHRSSRAHRHRSRRQRRHDECQVSRVAQSRRRARPRPRRSGLGGDSGTNRDSSFSYAGTHHDDGRHGLSGSSKKEKGPGFKKGRKSPSVTPLAMCAWGG